MFFSKKTVKTYQKHQILQSTDDINRGGQRHLHGRQLHGAAAGSGLLQSSLRAGPLQARDLPGATLTATTSGETGAVSNGWMVPMVWDPPKIYG